MRWVRAIVCTLAFTAAAAAPARAETVVRWVTSIGVLTWEPSTDDSATQNGLVQVYEGLTLTDTNLTLHPALATSWVLVRPDAWRFTLRQGVRFHDGSPFTAADVAFSLDRAKGSERTVDFASVAAVTAIDEGTVEIVTKRPDLLLPVRLRRLFIMSKAWAERHGAERPARSGDAAAYTFAHEDGTGPFMIESFEPGKRTVLVRNPAWWGTSQSPHNLDRIVWTVEPDPERRLTLLLSGEVDLLQDPPLDRLDRLRGAPGIRLARMSQLGTLYLALDHGSTELRTSDVKGKNPFADRRVRQAMYQAIDIELLIAKAGGGFGTPAGMMAPPGVNGYDPELDQRLPYDPGRARALLTEAGYPNGFAVHLDCPLQRREVCLEVAAQFLAVGLRVTVDAVPFDVFKARVATRATDLYSAIDYAGVTFDSAALLRELFHSSQGYWLGTAGYASPAVDALVDRIDEELSTPIRDALIEQAWRIVLGDIAVIPLYHPLVVWAMRDTLELPVNPFNTPYFREAQLTSAPVH